MSLPPMQLAAMTHRTERVTTSTAQAHLVPDLRGLDARAALEQAVKSGYVVSTVGSGVVAEQIPAPGAVDSDHKVMLKLKSPGEPSR